MIRDFRPNFGLGRKKNNVRTLHHVLPTAHCPEYVPRKGPLAYLDTCARCNAREESHQKAKTPELVPRFRHAKEQLWWLIRDVASDSGWSLRSRLRIMRDACGSLKLLHSNGRSYGPSLRATAIMVGEDGLGGLRRPVPMMPKMDPFNSRHETRCKEDMQRFGKLMMLLLDEKVFNEHESLRVLKDQLIADEAETRPDAESTEDWIDSVLQEIGGAPEEPPKFASSRHPFYGFIELISQNTLEEDNLDGYDSDDSFFPGGRDNGNETEDERTERSDDGELSDGSRGSRDTTTSTGSSAIPRTGSGSKLNMFLTEHAAAYEEAMPTGRRRSASDDASGEAGGKARIALDGSMSVRHARRPSSGRFRPLSSATKNDFRRSWDRRQTRKMSLAVPSPKSVAARFDKQERLSEEEAMALISQAEQVLRRESNVLDINDSGTVQVFGDIHGQYFDIRHALETSGYSLDDDEDHPSRTLVFLGDYVDRGAWSCEVLFFILALKVARPSRVFLLRGNHECGAVVSYFGFKDEIETKYGTALFHRCIVCFQAMPLCAVVSTRTTKWMLCHGGISPRLNTLDDLKVVNRFAEPGMNGLFCDILWADPLNENENSEHAGFTNNASRGCSVRFGRDVLIRFLDANNLTGLVRAHEVMEDGVMFQYDGRLVTVFSAPNYCGQYGNRAAYLMIDYDGEEPLRAEKFDPAPEQPEPAAFNSVTMEINSGIAATLPFMPTTLAGFVTRALQLWSATAIKEAQDELVRQNSVLAKSPDHMAKRISSAAPSSTGTKGAGGGKNDAEEMMSDGGDVEDNDTDGDDDEDSDIEKEEVVEFHLDLPLTPENRTTKLSPFQRAKRKLSKAMKKWTALAALSSRFQTAKFSDGINEAHPSLTQFKLQSAELKMRLNRHASESHIMGEGSGRREEFEKRNSDLARKSSREETESVSSIKKEPPTPVESFEVLETMPVFQIRSRVDEPLSQNEQESGIESADLGPPLVAMGHGDAESDPGAPEAPHHVMVNMSLNESFDFDPTEGIPRSDAFDEPAPLFTPPNKTMETLKESGVIRSPRSPFTGGQVSFSDLELRNLQLLFLMIDRTDDGKISADEIVDWSLDEGERVSEEDAHRVVEAVDADLDGYIGLDDWLWFAHCCRELWLEETQDGKAASIATPPEKVDVRMESESPPPEV